jgi:hypothetical protein
MMSGEVSLKEAERAAFTTRFQDGLWDILLGCVILMFAVAPFLSEMGLGDFWSSMIFLPFWALVYLAIHLVRRHIVAPRIGVARFGPSRKARLVWLNVLLSVVLLAGLLMGLFWVNVAGVPTWLHLPPIVLAFSLVALVSFSAAAYLLDFTRLYAYGLLAALSPIVGEWLYVHAGVPHHGYPVTFGLTAGVMILTGLVTFLRFVREKPIPTPEPATGET